MTTRREVLLAGVATLGITRWRFGQSRPVPSPAQLTWQRDELALFLHFGVNTFTDREWGDGREDPGIFAPTALDARQWARTAKAAGFRAMILTAKHHDGFCLWPSRTTRHTVASSPWRGGTGDLVREFTDACRAEGLRTGLYCSPWDRNAPVYGDSARYNDMFCDQVTELLTGYGKIHEVWFDGANGEGPTGRKQVYDWPRFFGLVKKLQPDSVIFSDAGPDVRWIGNEKGVAGDPNWSTVDPSAVPYPGAEGEKVIAMLQHGDPGGTVWRPGEADVSIRPGWFHHPAEDGGVKSVEELVGLYFSSVGRNSKLLLNVPPTREGLIHPTDAERLAGMHTVLGLMFRDNHADRRRASWQRTDDRTASLTVDLGRAVNIRILDLAEDVSRGQVVARYVVHGEINGTWRPLSSGSTIGYRKLDQVDARDVSRLRVTIEDSVDQPFPISLACYG